MGPTARAPDARRQTAQGGQPPNHQRRLKAGSEGESAVWVFTNARTREARTVNGVAHVFKRPLKRANILTGDVSLHTLRHTALSRMIASGIDDFTVMAISGHRSVRMLERYTHPTNARKIDALERIPASLGRTDQRA